MAAGFIAKHLNHIRNMWPRQRKVFVGSLSALALVFIWARWAPMRDLFEAPRSTVLEDRDGQLLGATVAADGQWRMPPGDSLPHRFVTCLLEFEDRHFLKHPGIHPPSLLRALLQNVRAGRTVSGGSTLTMQVARMSRPPGGRTLWKKLTEMLLALRIEMRHGKQQILTLYAANAPFGGNVVGLEAAAWRWFGTAPHALSWSECAMLAVLPNAPSRIHPGRQREALLVKRNRLLDRLKERNIINELEWSLAVEEPLPEAPLPLPNLAPHLLATLEGQGMKGQRIRTTLDASLQQRTLDAAQRHAMTLRANEVHNAAVLMLETGTGHVLAYMGNLPEAGAEHSGWVDVVQASRSTGSLLKPFLHAAMLQQGERMPDQLVADIPTRYPGFAPQNYDQQFTGAVPASRALARSLNVPAVRALKEHGVERALRTFRAMGLTRLNRSAEHYGLSLIVGGAESSLWELAGAYASLGRISNAGVHADLHHVHPPLLRKRTSAGEHAQGPPALGAASAYHTLQALRSLDRAGTLDGWDHHSSDLGIAWKTGTSYGHRDAWAIGVTSRHVVAVWTGNASGEGRPELTGTLAAAPLMFELFSMLPEAPPFEPPYDLMTPMAVCARSGFKAGKDCDRVDTAWTLLQAMRTGTCPYHQRILVDADARFRVVPGPEARSVAWFVLPPAMEHYHAAFDITYRPMPPWLPGLAAEDGTPAMELLYPDPGGRVLVPVHLDGTPGSVVLHAAHRDAGASLFWDIDGEHVGVTHGDHRVAVDPPAGLHRLTLTDRSGRSLQTSFSVERSQAKPSR